MGDQFVVSFTTRDNKDFSLRKQETNIANYRAASVLGSVRSMLKQRGGVDHSQQGERIKELGSLITLYLNRG